MSALGLVLFEAYSLWLKSIASCASCAPPIIPCLDRQKAARHEVEKADFVIHRDQPGFMPPPSLDPLARTTQAEPLVERPVSAARRAGRRAYAVQKRLWSSRGSSSALRPRISAPTNFQHISTGSLQFAPSHRPRQRPRSFRPLELSIHAANNHLSPMLPRFEEEERQRCIDPPQPVHLRDSFDSDASTLGYQESSSSSSFHIPRRPVPQRSMFSADHYDSPPTLPSRSRLRAVLTSPERVDTMVERIASAMLEKESLQSEIESIVERQSSYMSSRPATAHGVEKIAPMPSIPAMPAAAPSFAQRLSLDQNQSTAPQKTAVAETSITTSHSMFDLSHLPRTQPRLTSASTYELLEKPVGPPPLPHVFRPPLRKKKSFSRVSTWIFPDSGPEQAHWDQGTSFEALTRAAMPAGENDGFYAYVGSPARRGSIATVSSLSTWSADEEQSYVTTLSPPSTSPTRSNQDASTTPRTSRMLNFGRLSINARQHRPQSVGIAY